MQLGQSGIHPGLSEPNPGFLGLFVVPQSSQSGNTSPMTPILPQGTNQVPNTAQGSPGQGEGDANSDASSSWNIQASTREPGTRTGTGTGTEAIDAMEGNSELTAPSVTIDEFADTPEPDHEHTIPGIVNCLGGLYQAVRRHDHIISELREQREEVARLNGVADRLEQEIDRVSREVDELAAVMLGSGELR